jgi:hypothetical protein
MLKIHIKETFPGARTVAVWVDGSLDGDTIPILDHVCRRHWEEGREVQVHLAGVIRISREGMDFLREIQDKAQLVNPPKFIKLENMEGETGK